MPIAPTYPGVYIQEIPSGVRTITGVATSITAFVGRAATGPTDTAALINSYADYERQFGGLSPISPMSFAVRDFYLNGGSQAIIVRLYHSTAQQAAEDTAGAVAGANVPAAVASVTAKAATYIKDPQKSAAAAVLAAVTAANVPGATVADLQKAAQSAAAGTSASGGTIVTAGNLNLAAASPGKWAKDLRVRVDHDTKDTGPPLNLAAADQFNLSVRNAKTGETEVYLGLTVKTGTSRTVDKVLGQSNLVRVSGTLPPTRPAENDNPDPGKGIWDDIKPGGKNTYYFVQDADLADDGTWLTAINFTGPGFFDSKKGLYALRKADLFNLLCIPPFKDKDSIDYGLVDDAIAFCKDRRAMLLIDPPADWKTIKNVTDNLDTQVGSPSSYAAIFFPRLSQPNPLNGNQFEPFVPCGAVAGVFARTDSQRGVWKAPAGLDATLVGVPDLTVPMTDLENGVLNQLGVNCLRILPAAGRVVWGARTRDGADRTASEWKYIPVRRLALYLEESLYRGTQWVVFEPNDNPLWAQIRLNIGAFMHGLFRQGAFQGSSPAQAYFVKCDGETTTQTDINNGIVNIIVGFAPLKPAEFVVISLQQIAGQIAV